MAVECEDSDKQYYIVITTQNRNSETKCIKDISMKKPAEIDKAIGGKEDEWKAHETWNAYYDWGYLNRNLWALGRHVDRLAAYEDIGLSPEEITDMIYRFEAFLSAMTGNRMSKSNYTLDAMISAANDYQQSLCDGCWDRSELAKYYEGMIIWVI